MQNSKTIPTKKQVQKYIHGAFFKSYPVKKLMYRKPGLGEAMSRKTYFLYSSNFSFDLPLYILDGVKQVVPLCTITLGLYVPIWQTPPLPRPSSPPPDYDSLWSCKAKSIENFQNWRNVAKLTKQSCFWQRHQISLARKTIFFKISPSGKVNFGGVHMSMHGIQ